MTKYIDLTGQTFGRLTVIKKAKSDKRGTAQWLCECSCGNKEIIVRSDALRSGGTQSCGCLRFELNKKYNIYDLSGEYGVGYASNTNEEFYFDLEDYDLIKDCCWFERNDGYMVTNLDNKILYLHKLIIISEDKMVDHINRNRKDNRKNNLRIVTNQQNSMNKNLKSDNTSGITGISWSNEKEKWHTYININKKRINLGYFDNFNNAIAVRLQAEKELFGEYASQQYLYEQYGIN